MGEEGGDLGYVCGLAMLSSVELEKRSLEIQGLVNTAVMM